MFSPNYTLENDQLILEVYSVGSLGANSTLIKDKANNSAIVIDPGLDEDYCHFLCENYSIKALIHTHAHFDHIGNSHIIKSSSNAPIMLHQADLSLYQKLKEQAQMFGFEIEGALTVDKLFAENDSLELECNCSLNDFLKSIKVIHTPGHTQGSVCFYTEIFEKKILIAGDTLFIESIGRTDLPGGSYTDILSSIKNKLYNLSEETMVITGHGPFTTIKHEKAHNPFTK